MKSFVECAVGSRRGSRTSCPVCPVDSTSGINWLARAVERQTSEEEHSYNHKTGDNVFLRHWDQTWIIQQTTFIFVVLVPSVWISLTLIPLYLETRKVRKHHLTGKTGLFLVQYANQTTIPSPRECSELTRAGLGTLSGSFQLKIHP